MDSVQYNSPSYCYTMSSETLNLTLLRSLTDPLCSSSVTTTLLFTNILLIFYVAPNI
jgi:hypothetical protein